jgi:D-sedoheptulose 7-phosphate isomerase
MSQYEQIKQHLSDAIAVKQAILNNDAFLQKIEDITDIILDCYRKDGKLLFCGNGGSAADAQHLAAEFSGKLYKDREPLNAEALHVNTSYLTAVANDYSFDEVYSRLVKAKGRKGDILFAISTSGNSRNIIRAAQMAKELGLIVIGMTGESGGGLRSSCDVLINIPSSDTQRIQEAHIMVGHIICQIVEENYFA